MSAQTGGLTQKLENIKTKYNLVGLSVAVVKDGKLDYENSLGMQDIDRNIGMKISSKYRIASVSKMITATAMMKLYEEGKFSFNDDVSKILGYQLRNPSFPDDVITVQSVLSHTASLRDGSAYDSFLSASYSTDSVPDIKELLVPGGKYYSSSIWSGTRPSQKYFQYSNINFGVVATLIEKLSGKRFDQYCKEVLFDRMNIDGSFNIQDLKDINQLAVLYRKSGSSWAAQTDNYKGIKPAARNLTGYIPGTNGLIFSPQGGLRISAGDLAKFAVMFINKGKYNEVQILSDSTIARLFKTVWTYSPGNGDNYYGIFNNYASGNHTTSELIKNEFLTGHPGEAYGLISDFYFSQSKKYAVVFLTNGGSWGYGSYSGWYNVEEEIFNACFSELDNLTVSVNEKSKEEAEIIKNYPNPFNPVTTIRYSVKKNSMINVGVYNVLGQKISTLVNSNHPEGEYETFWDASGFTSGIYFCRFSSEYEEKQTKMILLK